MQVQSLDWEDALEKGSATHSSILAWRIPWTKSMGSQRVRHETTERLSLHSLDPHTSLLTARVFKEKVVPSTRKAKSPI